MPDLSHLRISFVAGTLARGGSERQLFYMTRALKRAGAAVQVLSLTNGEFWQEKLEAAGVPVRWVGQHSSKAMRLAAIVRELRLFRPAILQSQHFYTNPYVLVAARWLGLQEVGAIRSGTKWSVTRNFVFIRKFSLLRLKHLISNSQEAIDEAIELGVPPERLTLLPNVIDLDQFCPKPAVESPDAPLQLLNVGRLGPEKRQDIFLRVLARVRAASERPVTGRIVGAGTELETLVKQAAGLGLTRDRMEFAGALADMAPAYQSAGMFVLTSDHEGTPNVVLEAMACGLPVVATRVGGVPKLIEHERSGILCDCGDEDALTAAVLRLAANPEFRRELGRRARQVVEEKYAEDLLPGWLKQVYEVTAA